MYFGFDWKLDSDCRIEYESMLQLKHGIFVVLKSELSLAMPVNASI